MAFSYMYEQLYQQQQSMKKCEVCWSLNPWGIPSLNVGIPSLNVPERTCIGCLLQISRRSFDLWMDNSNLREQLLLFQHKNEDLHIQILELQEQQEQEQKEQQQLHHHTRQEQVAKEQEQQEQEKGRQQFHMAQEQVVKDQEQEEQEKGEAAAAGISFGSIGWTPEPVFPWSKGEASAAAAGICFGSIDWPASEPVIFPWSSLAI